MPEEVKKYERRTKTPEQALSSLMRLCAKAERSSGDALRLMRNWGVADGDARRVLAKLQEQRFIDDARYATAYVRDKTRFSGWGIHKIKAGLRLKGISAEIISRVTEAEAAEPAGERLSQILERKARTMKEDNPYARKTKLIRYGLSRGFGFDEVLHAASLITGAEWESEYPGEE